MRNKAKLGEKDRVILAAEKDGLRPRRGSVLPAQVAEEAPFRERVRYVWVWMEGGWVGR